MLYMFFQIDIHLYLLINSELFWIKKNEWKNIIKVEKKPVKKVNFYSLQELQLEYNLFFLQINFTICSTKVLSSKGCAEIFFIYLEVKILPLI